MRGWLAPAIGAVCIAVFVMTRQQPTQTTPPPIPRALNAAQEGMVADDERSLERELCPAMTPPQVTAITEKGQPRLWQGCATGWRALERWNPAYLGGHPSFKGIQIKTRARRATEHPYPAQSNFFRYIDKNAPTKSIFLTEEEEAAAFTLVNTTGSEFFGRYDKAAAQRNVHGYYAAALSGSILGDLGDVGKFVTTFARRLFAAGMSEEPYIGIFVADEGVTASTHHDSYDNFFTQIWGEKTFVLYPPDAWEAMYMFPRLHPHARHAQVAARDPRTEADRFILAGTIPPPLVVHLSPGDTLYIPPFWFHHVVADTDSISVNAWSPSREFQAMQDQLAEGLPFEWEWGDAQRASATSAFMAALVARLYGPHSAVTAESLGLGIASRYAHARPVHDRAPEWWESVPDLGCSGGAVGGAEIVGKLGAYARRMADAWAETLPEATRGLHLSNLWEDLALWSVGPEHVWRYFQQCASSSPSSSPSSPPSSSPSSPPKDG